MAYLALCLGFIIGGLSSSYYIFGVLLWVAYLVVFRPTSTIRRAGTRKDTRLHAAAQYEKGTAVLISQECPYMAYLVVANATLHNRGI